MHWSTTSVVTKEEWLCRVKSTCDAVGLTLVPKRSSRLGLWLPWLLSAHTALSHGPKVCGVLFLVPSAHINVARRYLTEPWYLIMFLQPDSLLRM